MFRKIIFYFSVVSLFLLQTAYAESRSQPLPQTIACAPELKSCLAKIEQLPEARELIATIQKEGSIRITVNNDPHLTKEFGAFWNPRDRIITVNYAKQISEGSLIGSIIFEMHNALVNAKMLNLDNLAAHGKIDRNTYVEQFERLEYKNSKDASRLVQKGIDRGIFPRSAYLPTYSTFEEHYFVQKESGHSGFIAKNFDQLAPRKRNTRNQSAGYSYHRHSRTSSKVSAG